MDNNWQEWKERIVGYTRKIKQADRGQKRTRLAILFLCGLLLLVVAVAIDRAGVEALGHLGVARGAGVAVVLVEVQAALVERLAAVGSGDVQPVGD